MKISPTQEIWDLFAPKEGFNSVYYGKTRNGKTRTATADIIELLSRGEVVYANWFIDISAFDERTSRPILWVKLLTRNSYLYKFDRTNFYYFHPDEIDVLFLGKLVGVHLFIDEGQWIFNSHIRDGASDPLTIAKRKLVLHGGHYCRSLNVITQRPSNILKDIRSQVNIWYRCVKRLDIFGHILFQRFEIEDMKDDLPIEFDSENKPLGKCKTYWVNKKNDKVFKAYNTHGMRAKDSIAVKPNFEVYEYKVSKMILLLLNTYLPQKWRFKRHLGQ